MLIKSTQTLNWNFSNRKMVKSMMRSSSSCQMIVVLLPFLMLLLVMPVDSASSTASNEIPKQQHHVKGIVQRTSTTTTPSPSNMGMPDASSLNDWSGLFRLLSYILISGIGASGSIFIISALTVVSVLQSRGNSFLASQCLAHLIVTVFILPSTAISIMSGAREFDPTLCHYQWLATESTLLLHVLSFLLISFDSWKGLGSVVSYNDCITKTRIIIVSLFIWISTIALITVQHVNNYAPNVCTKLQRYAEISRNHTMTSIRTIPVQVIPLMNKKKQHHHYNVYGHNNSLPGFTEYLVMEESLMNEFSDYSHDNDDDDDNDGTPKFDMTYHSVIGIICILIPTILTIFFFSRSAVIMKRHRMYMSENPLTPIYLLTDQHLLKSHIIVYVFSFIMWSPICILAIVDELVDRGSSLDVPGSLIDTSWSLALANSCCFSYIYAFTNRDFGESFLQLFYYCCCKSHVNWVRKTTVGGLNQMSASRSAVAQSVPSVSITGSHHHHGGAGGGMSGHHYHHGAHIYQGAASAVMSGHHSRSHHHGSSSAGGMGMVAMGGGVSGGGICGGGPFRAFQKGRMATEL